MPPGADARYPAAILRNGPNRADACLTIFRSIHTGVRVEPSRPPLPPCPRPPVAAQSRHRARGNDSSREADAEASATVDAGRKEGRKEFAERWRSEPTRTHLRQNGFLRAILSPLKSGTTEI